MVNRFRVVVCSGVGDQHQEPAREIVVTRTKVLLAVESHLFREVLRERIENEDGVELLEQSLDPIDLLVAVGQTEADIVILSWPANGEMPPICTHLFAEYPELVVFGLREDSDAAVVCRQTIARTHLPAVGLQEMLSVMRQPVAETA